jgi:hypothetical protein
MPIVLKSGILNLLEPSGPVQGCIEIALPYRDICDRISSASLSASVPDKRKSRDLWAFEGYDTHTHKQALLCFHSSVTQIVLQSITGGDLVSECFQMIQLQFPSRLASVDVELPVFMNSSKICVLVIDGLPCP